MVAVVVVVAVVAAFADIVAVVNRGGGLGVVVAVSLAIDARNMFHFSCLCVEKYLKNKNSSPAHPPPRDNKNVCFPPALPQQVRLTTLNGAEILSLGQWEACRALREAFSTAEGWSSETDSVVVTEERGGAGGGPAAGNPRRCTRCAVIFLDEADALLAR